MAVKLLIEHTLEFPSLKGGCTVSYESTLVKMRHCWKSHVLSICMRMKRVKENCETLYFIMFFFQHDIKVVRDPCQKITLLLLKSKSVRVIVPESCF